MLKLLITGISGFLGWHLAEHQPAEWEILGTFHKNTVYDERFETVAVDLNEYAQVRSVLESWRPDAVLHVAAFADVNACERAEETSYRVNVEATVRLAELCAKKDVLFSFISTDQVFSGVAAPYAEDDPLDPIQIYGRHKAQAEQAILQVHPAAAVIRLPLLYGWPQRGANFLPNWVDQMHQGKTVFAFTDEYRTPLSGRDAARGLYFLLSQQVTGIWHLGGPERLSRYDFGVQIAHAFGLPAELVRPSLQTDVNMPAARPPDVSLTSAKVRSLGFQPDSIAENLRMLREGNDLKMVWE